MTSFTNLRVTHETHALVMQARIRYLAENPGTRISADRLVSAAMKAYLEKKLPQSCNHEQS